jgi:thioredoxin-related protein
MKKSLLFFVLLAAGFGANAQLDSTRPYLRFPTLPPLQILLTDSTTMFTKEQLPEKTPVLYILFDPGCSHCQHETEELVKHKEDFKNTQIVMVSMPRTPFADVTRFINDYKVNELHHVVVGRDIQYFMPSFYTIRNFPFLALYNSKGKLITTFEGTIPMDKILENFKSAR